MRALGRWNGEQRAVVVRERVTDGLELAREVCDVERLGSPVVVVLCGGRYVVPADGVLRIAAQGGTRWRVVAWVSAKPDGAA